MGKYKNIVMISFLIICVTQNIHAAELVIAVDNIKAVKGSLYVSIYNNAISFDTNDNAIKRQKIAVYETTVIINLGDITAGEYAIKAYHDVNDNGKLDFSNLGMPSEPFGSSSQGKELTPPDYNSAKFILDKNQKVQIHLLN